MAYDWAGPQGRGIPAVATGADYAASAAARPSVEPPPRGVDAILPLIAGSYAHGPWGIAWQWLTLPADAPPAGSVRPGAAPISREDYETQGFARPGLEWYPRLSAARAQALAQNYDDLAAHNRLMAANPGEALFAELVAGVADPINLVPVAGPVAKGATVLRLSRTAAAGFAAAEKTLLGRALIGGVDATLSTAIVEAAVAPLRGELGQDVSLQSYLQQLGYAGLSGFAFGVGAGALGKLVGRIGGGDAGGQGRAGDAAPGAGPGPDRGGMGGGAGERSGGTEGTTSAAHLDGDPATCASRPSGTGEGLVAPTVSRPDPASRSDADRRAADATYRPTTGDIRASSRAISEVARSLALKGEAQLGGPATRMVTDAAARARGSATPPTADAVASALAKAGGAEAATRLDLADGSTRLTIEWRQPAGRPAATRVSDADIAAAPGLIVGPRPVAQSPDGTIRLFEVEHLGRQLRVAEKRSPDGGHRQLLVTADGPAVSAPSHPDAVGIIDARAQTRTDGPGDSAAAEADAPTAKSRQPSNRPGFWHRLRRSYQKAFFEKYPELYRQVEIHHAIEQRVFKLYPGVITKEEMHGLDNLRGIPLTKEGSRLHRSFIRDEWSKFYESHPVATKEQLMAKARDIDRRFGHLFRPPV